MREEKQKSQLALKIAGLSLSYGGVRALEDVNLSLSKGVRAAIVGPNGAGKSSLMKAVLGLEVPSSGKVHLLGEEGDGSRRIQKAVAYVPQASQVNWQFPATVYDMVLMGRFAHAKGWLKRPSKEDKEVVEAALEKMAIQDLARRQIDQLSGGQRQRVFLARALAQEADFYIMDEPLAGVDQVTETIIMATLKDFQEQGKTSLVVHHDLTSLATYFDYLIWFNRSVVASGPLDEVLTQENYQATYGSGQPVFREGVPRV